MGDVRQATSLASKYNKDPNSLTLADAKAGLSVANKVLPRTEDTGPPNRQDVQTAATLGQKWNKDPKSLGWNDFKAGYAVANKFRPPPSTTPQQPDIGEQETTATGVNDLKSRFASVSLGGMKPPPKTPAQQQPHPSPTSPSGKKAPPPPKPKPLSLTVLPPIPYNIATKPNISTKPTSWAPKDIPLDLERGWYATDPMQQIPYLTAHASTAISASAISASGSGSPSHMIWVYTAVFAIRWTTDLSRTFIRLTWSSENPETTVRATQKHFPPPTPLPAPDLEKCAGLYGPGVVGFARGQVGRQVGDGECWTLAHDALEFVQQTVEPRCMVSNGKIHGQVVFTCDAEQAVGGALEGVRTGDIVQYLECKFERRVNGRVVHSSSAGSPDHTT
jgi:myosin tail region-interacting protein MTI1